MVVRDLRVLSQPLDAEVLHYRDQYGVEADAVVQVPDGRWAAFPAGVGGSGASGVEATSPCPHALVLLGRSPPRSA